jgi:hypothetical protein
MAQFLRWMLGPGQMQAAALGYLALPKDLVSREEAAISSIHRLFFLQTFSLRVRNT